MRKHADLLPEIAIVGLFLGNDLSGDIEETQILLDKKGELQAVMAKGIKVHRLGFLVSQRKDPLTRMMGASFSGDLLLRIGILERLNLAPERLRVRANPRDELERGTLDETSLVALDYILKSKRYLEERDKRLLVFIIVESYYVGRYPTRQDGSMGKGARKNQHLTKAVIKWCQENSVECINPVPRFQKLEDEGVRLYFAINSHWNREGHNAAAQIIAEYLMENPTKEASTPKKRHRQELQGEPGLHPALE